VILHVYISLALSHKAESSAWLALVFRQATNIYRSQSRPLDAPAGLFLRVFHKAESSALHTC
jgi:hypothetical protein